MFVVSYQHIILRTGLLCLSLVASSIVMQLAYVIADFVLVSCCKLYSHAITTCLCRFATFIANFILVLTFWFQKLFHKFLETDISVV